MLTALQGMAKQLDAVLELLESLEPATMRARDAVQMLQAASAVEQKAALIKTLVADKAARRRELGPAGLPLP